MSMSPSEHLRVARLNLLTTLGASGSPRSAAMQHLISRAQPPGPCYFQRLPPELRLRIFQLVLQHDRPLAPAQIGQRINIAPLLLNKLFSQDALDAFYETNTIRIHQPQQLELQTAGGSNMLQLVRRLELGNGKNDRWWLVLNRDKFRAFLDCCRNLPKLQTVTIGCAGLSELGMSVRTWVAYLLATHVVCIDIGRYSVGGAYSHVRIEHLSLIRRWQQAKELMESYARDPAVLMNHMRTAAVAVPYGPLCKRMLEWSRIDLAFFVTGHLVAEGYFNGVPIPLGHARGQLIVQFCERFRLHLVSHAIVGPALRKYKWPERPTSIARMEPGSDSMALEWATELLARHMKGEEDWRKHWEGRPQFPWFVPPATVEVALPREDRKAMTLAQRVAAVYPKQPNGFDVGR